MSSDSEKEDPGDQANEPRYLPGYFLVSDIDLRDPNFYRSVVLMVSHDDNGALGLVVNRPSPLSLGEMVEGMRKGPAAAVPVFVGGPVQQEILFCLHGEFDGCPAGEDAMFPIEGVCFEPLTRQIVTHLTDQWSALGPEEPHAGAPVRGVLGLGAGPARRRARRRRLARREGDPRDHVPPRAGPGLGGCVRAQGAALADHPADGVQAVHELAREAVMSGELVLVTGGSGFVGAHCILQLLGSGYRVRTTVRDLKREADVRSMLTAGGADPGNALSFTAADLTADEGWPAAVAGCACVLHVASPFPPSAPRNEDELIVPAREGALRVLKAARDAGVRRVVMTSSFAAIGYGQKITDRPFTEENWTNPNGSRVTAYAKSKTLAERAAWDFVEREGRTLELSVVNPVAIFGPVLGPDYSTSIMLLRRLLDGAVPGLPRLSFGVVDVRDVADLHIRAMTAPAAKGQRFLAISGEFMTVEEMARVLKARLGIAAARVPTRVLPNWMVRLAALFDPAIAQSTPELGKLKRATNEKARRLLGWSPRSNEEAIIATAESLLTQDAEKALPTAVETARGDDARPGTGAGLP